MAEETEWVDSAVKQSADELREKRRADHGAYNNETPEERRKRWREYKRAKRAENRGETGRPPREYRKRESIDKETDTEKRPPYKPDEMSIKMCAKLGNVLWDFSRMLHGRRALTEKEQTEFGEALDPVLYKYLPVLNDWAVEVNLLGTCFSIWNATTPSKNVVETPGEKATNSSAEVVE